MRRVFAFSTIALAAALAACSHGGNGGTTPPVTQPQSANVSQQKMLREQERVPSSFVAPKHPGFIAEMPDTQTWTQGIAQAGEAPVPGGMFDIVNQYNTIQNGLHVTVYAGSIRPTGAGILLVVRRSADLHTVNAQTMTVASSAVRIESASGSDLQLQQIGRSAQAIQVRVPL